MQRPLQLTESSRKYMSRVDGIHFRVPNPRPQRKSSLVHIQCKPFSLCGVCAVESHQVGPISTGTLKITKSPCRRALKISQTYCRGRSLNNPIEYLRPGGRRGCRVSTGRFFPQPRGCVCGMAVGQLFAIETPIVDQIVEWQTSCELALKYRYLGMEVSTYTKNFTGSMNHEPGIHGRGVHRIPAEKLGYSNLQCAYFFTYVRHHESWPMISWPGR